jgi:hypothetical protein
VSFPRGQHIGPAREAHSSFGGNELALPDKDALQGEPQSQ